MTLVIISPVWATQEQDVKEANARFQNEEWDKAIDLYVNALSHKENADIVQYNLGSAFYKKGNYDQSIEHLNKAFSQKNKNLNSKAHFNLGNALYKKAASLENKDLKNAIENLEKSIGQYDLSTSLDPKDKDAQYNKNIAQKELERLKKKQEEQKQQQKQQDQDKKDSKDSKDQKGEQQKQESANKNDEESQVKQDQAKKDEDRSAQEKSQEEKDKEEKENKEAQEQQAKEQDKQVKDGKSKSGQAQAKEGQGSKEEQALEEKQAKELILEYEQQDAPKGLLNFMDRRKRETHVQKDW